MGPASWTIAGSIAATLVAATEPPSWKPATAPPPTAWARAGARSWRSCDELGRKALHDRLVRSGAARLKDRTWRTRMARCPGEPEVLVLAAEEELIESARLGWFPDPGTPLDAAVERHHESITASLDWLDRALVEARRRGDNEPFEARYLRALALMGLGHYPDAARELKRVARRGDVARWRVQRVAAIAALLGGELDEALRLALGSLADAPPDDTQISRYIWAIVLDRAGAPASARAALITVRRDPSHTAARAAVEGILPIHERLYLRALEHQSNDEKSNAIRLWAAYLSRPEPEEADRVLAKRHKAEL